MILWLYSQSGLLSGERGTLLRNGEPRRIAARAVNEWAVPVVHGTSNARARASARARAGHTSGCSSRPYVSRANPQTSVGRGLGDEAM